MAARISKSGPAVDWSKGAHWRAAGKPALASRLDTAIAVGVHDVIDQRWSSELVKNVLRARDAWTSDFGGEQFALGRAFYTHLETGRSKDYFDAAAESDRVVEARLPGLQSFALECFESMLGGRVRRRRGFCGPGVHVFPASGKVAREGGVVHFDLEGLTPHQIEKSHRAMTLVVMLGPGGERGGGLRLWDALFDGRADTEVETEGVAHATVRLHGGDAILFDSHRLHQIRPFSGSRDRISVTVHGVEVDRDTWEAWF